MRNIIKLITNRSENYDFYFPLKKTLKLRNMAIAVRSAFYEDSKFYLPFFVRIWLWTHVQQKISEKQNKMLRWWIHRFSW